MLHFLLLSVFIATLCVKADDAQHTGCYDYFLKKDGCVHGSSGTPCPANSAKTSTSCNAFKIDPTCKVAQQQAALQTSPQSSSRLARRYDTTIPTLAVAGGTGICGFYNSTETSGVCLWSGEGWLDSRGEAVSGWLNGTRTENCRKQVYVQRQGQPETVQYAPVLDGCEFFAQGDPRVGCFQVWMTIDLFEKFSPTPEESASFQMNDTFTWDFVEGSNPV